MPEAADSEPPASEALPLPEAAEAEPPASEALPLPEAEAEPPIRAVLAKLGLDGHDRGIKVVARMLRDAGMEVIYLGLRQTTESIVAAVEQEDAEVIGLSMHNAGHLTLGPAMLTALDEAGLDVPVVIGGIVPDGDRAELERAGVAAVLGPGASAEEVVSAVRQAAAGR